MRIYGWNVNGLRAVARKKLLPWEVCEQAEVICLQEVKARPDALESGLAEPDGWYTVHHAAQKAGYSGVSILSKDQPDEVIEGMGAEEFDSEGRVLAVRFGTLVIASAYFPNSRDGGARLPYKLAFCAEMEKLLARWRKRGWEVALLGDYNIAHQPIDLARPKENQKNAGFLPEERAWMTRLLGLGVHDVWRERNPTLAGEYTWWTAWANARAKNVGWRIDYACVTAGLVGRVQDIRHHQAIMGSDHCPVDITLI
jgi:exodeoxyribonuclease-3